MEENGTVDETVQNASEEQVVTNGTNGNDMVVENTSTSMITRFESLLKQTETFSHFMTYGKEKQLEEQQRLKPGRKKKEKEIDVNDHRHRRTEEEEDAELLSESKKEVNIFR